MTGWVFIFLGLDYQVADGIADQFAEGVEIEFDHEAGAVGFDGPGAEVEGKGDLFIAVPFCQ